MKTNWSFILDVDMSISYLLRDERNTAFVFRDENVYKCREFFLSPSEFFDGQFAMYLYET